MKKIILASDSVYLHEILKEIGMDFDKQEIMLSEVQDSNSLLAGEQQVKTTAQNKAHSIVVQSDDTIATASHSQIYLNGERILTPSDENTLKDTLLRLSGKQCVVLTGYCFLDISTGQEINDLIENVVNFNKFDREEMMLANNRVEDPSGSNSFIGFWHDPRYCDSDKKTNIKKFLAVPAVSELLRRSGIGDISSTKDQDRVNIRTTNESSQSINPTILSSTSTNRKYDLSIGMKEIGIAENSNLTVIDRDDAVQNRSTADLDQSRHLLNNKDDYIGDIGESRSVIDEHGDVENKEKYNYATSSSDINYRNYQKNGSEDQTIAQMSVPEENSSDQNYDKNSDPQTDNPKNRKEFTNEIEPSKNESSSYNRSEKKNDNYNRSDPGSNGNRGKKRSNKKESGFGRLITDIYSLFYGADTIVWFIVAFILGLIGFSYIFISMGLVDGIF